MRMPHSSLLTIFFSQQFSRDSNNEGVCEMQKEAARVVYPAEYGGDPRREEESSEAFQKALEEAFAVEEGDERELVGGVKDLGEVVIELGGGIYKIGESISFPSAAGNLVLS
ncbi:hypothetical protein K1719_002430 [Acacia pycnantha]|nr:hypothetical protein K1719_002430 [Acacia pycnantha]